MSALARAVKYPVRIIKSQQWKGYERIAPLVSMVEGPETLKGAGLDAEGPEPLAKSIFTAGTGVDAASFTGGRATQYESLDSKLQSITLTEEDCRFWQLLNKVPVHSTIDQFNRHTSRGNEWGSAKAEYGNPQYQIQAIARAYMEMAHYKELRQISDVSMMVNMQVNPALQQEQDGMINILHKLSKHLFWNVRAALPTGVNGFWAQVIAPSEPNIVDLGGDILDSQQPIHQLAARMRNRGGRMTHLVMNPLLQEDFNSLFENAQRVSLPVAAERMYAGGYFGGMRTAFGTIDFESDPFNEVGWPYPTVAQGFTDRPGAPTLTSATAGSSGGTIPTGTYYYRVTAINADGESISDVSDPVSVTLGQTVTLVITPNGAGEDATGYRIYRSAKDGVATDCRYLWVAADSGEATTSFVDDGTWVPGTAHIAVADMRQQATTMQWSQLQPAAKKNLAPLGDWEWFLIVLRGVFRMAKPEWNGIIRNVLPSVVLDEGWDPLGLHAA